MNMERSAAARSIRRVLMLLTVAVLVGIIYYALFVGASVGALYWLLALGALLNGLYALVFAREEAAITGDRYRRHRWERALNLGVEPSERSVRWSAIVQVV